jgi:murein DD-endopeptidase MepM/ murein hydrolase activator NlpD
MTSGQAQPRVRRKKTRRIFLVVLFTVVLVAAAFLALEFLSDKRITTESARRPADVEPVASKPAPVSLVEHRERLRSGATIGEVLERHGFSPTEVVALCEQTKPIYDLHRIKAGQELRFYLNLELKIERLEYDIDETRYLSIERQGENSRAGVKVRPVDVEVKEIWGAIEENPIQAFNQLGEEDALALAFADLFGWDVDFYTDIRQGDAFKVIFERRFREGRFTGYGRILAAEFVNQGRVHQAFFFALPDTNKPGYYDADGKSKEKEFRKSPIMWARVSSRFSSHRLHPIRKVYTAHYGVDYAAPVGTPIQATADGTVTFAGWNGASGRMVRLRHKNNYETMYLHLSSFGAGIRPGVKVKGGDVIGFVGSSGESTGPHLDYRITRGGGYLNPLSAKFEPVEPLKPEYLEDYRKSIQKYQILLENPLAFFSPGLF